VALLDCGEGWHNNHHAFAHSARLGLEWYQIDITYCCICALSALGLAWDIRLPTEADKARKRQPEQKQKGL
jgi:stearoyl-CoA desaturase (delta-9 desaturase)